VPEETAALILIISSSQPLTHFPSISSAPERAVFREPGPPSEPARRGRARPGYASVYVETPRRSPGLARLALEELSQSLSLKAQTGYHGQPSGMLQSRRWNLMPQRPRSWTGWPRELASAAYPGKILRQNWAYMKRFPTCQEHQLSSAASGFRLPLPTCPPAATPRKSGCLQVAMAGLLTPAQFFATFLAQER
jgi:hypothetical protein